jgi:hypothetical protein
MEFEELQLRGGSDQVFSIPPLGPKAETVTRLGIFSSGHIDGLQQFTNVTALHVDHFPRNGLDITRFGKLEHFSCEWQKDFLQVFGMRSVVSLDLFHFPEHDCRLFQSMPQLKSVSLTQGALKTLLGLEGCEHLEELSLSYLRNFTDLDSLNHFTQLRHIDLRNLPKVKGTVTVAAFPVLQTIYVANAPVTVDLSSLNDLSQLEKLWLAAPLTNLSWDKLFSRPRLRLAGLFAEADTPKSDAFFIELAKKYGRRLEKIERAGPRGRHIQLTFSVET